MDQPILEVKHLKKYFRVGKKQLKAVDDVSFSVADADANISGQRRNRTCSAVPAKWNPVQIRI